MLSATAPVGITFNGEIYGYRDLRESLGKVYPFRTASDTEVILASYLKNGPQWLEGLPGMFAFALWDDSRGELLCARDRFGEKPFFYAYGPNGEFLFASEIKALLASGLLKPVLDRQSVRHYLKRLYVPPSRTIFRNVHTLPPAHRLCFRDGRHVVERYWRLPGPTADLPVEEAVVEFRRLLDRAVSRQLVADVPVGVFLSGGLDSSTVVAVASSYRRGLRTYSFGFEESMSELPFAREVADRCGTDHVELKDEGTDIGDLLVEMAGVYDEPFADSSNIPTYLISKLARQHGKVVLTGDGGDELLAGYASWYRPLFLMEREPGYRPLRMAWAWLMVRACKAFRSRSLPLWKERRAVVSLRRRFGSIAEAHLGQNSYFSDPELKAVGLEGEEGDSPVLPDWPLSGTVDDAMRMDLLDYMPGDILVKTDRASMANGLELRAPFLDVDFASFCISLPSRLKISAEEDKIILRLAYAEAWPPAIRARSKQGFGAPVDRWLKRGSVRALREKYLGDPGCRIFSLLRHEPAWKLATRDDYRTWALLVLSLWLERHDCDLG
jgi:asparagine synthase (glutamine-hydrolysing)